MPVCPPVVFRGALSVLSFFLLACSENKEGSELENPLAAFGLGEVEVVSPEPAPAPVDEEREWKDLIDAGLNKWEPMLSPRAPEGVAVQDVFSVERVDGVLVLTVTGKAEGALTSADAVSDFHLSAEFKWGERKWGKWTNRERSSGILYHCTGEQGALLDVWSNGVEFDISEDGLGGLYALFDINVKVEAETVSKNEARYTPGVPARRIGKSAVYRCLPAEVAGRAGDGWTRLDLYVLGDRAVHFVNCERTLALEEAAFTSGTDGRRRLKEGKLEIQSEGAEVFFRNLRISPITALPEGG